MLLRVFDPRSCTAHLGDEPAGPSSSEAPSTGQSQRLAVKGAFPLNFARSNSQLLLLLLLLLLLEEPVGLLSVLLHLSSTASQAMSCAWPQHRNLVHSSIAALEPQLPPSDIQSSGIASIIHKARG